FPAVLFAAVVIPVALGAIAAGPRLRIVTLAAVVDPRHEHIAGTGALRRGVALAAGEHPVLVMVEPAVREPSARNARPQIPGQPVCRGRRGCRVLRLMAVTAPTRTIEEDALGLFHLTVYPAGDIGWCFCLSPARQHRSGWFLAGQQRRAALHQLG